MQVIFHDDFIEAVETPLDDHKPDTGSSWLRYAATLSNTQITVKPVGRGEAPNVVGSTGSENGVYALYTAQPAPTQANVRVSFDRYMNNWEVSNTYLTGVGARISNNGATGYYIQMVPNQHSNESIRLYRRVNGVNTLLGSYDHPFSDGDVIEFECFDDGKRVYVEGALVIDVLDNVIEGAGEVGIYWGGLITNGHIRAEVEYGFFTVEAEEGSSGNAIDAAASLSGSSNVDTAGVLVRGLKSDLSGHSALAAQAKVVREAALGVIGYSQVEADAEVQPPDALYAHVMGIASATAQARMVLSGAATIAGQGLIQAEASIKGLIPLAAHIGGSSACSASARRSLGAAAVVSGVFSGTAFAHMQRDAGAITLFNVIEIDLCPRCAQEADDLPHIEDISTDFIIRGV